MPASTKKGLHLANSVSELNNLAGHNIPKVTNARLFVKSAEKLYKTAQESDLMGDEEKAYVQFMKFFNVVMAIKKSPEYKKNKTYYDGLIGANTCSVAINKAESLANSLKNRYEEREAEEVSKKLDKIDEAADKSRKEQDEKKAKDAEGEEEELKKKQAQDEEKKPETPGSITVSDLYRLMQDKEVRLLLIDVRLAEEFQESRINFKDCISVPSSCVQPGSTTLKIEKSLPSESRDLWNQRANVDHIILLDWNSSVSQLETGSVLKSLKDALFKWDQTTIIKSEPLVLEGGYNEWLTCYPTLTTNSAVTRPPVPSTGNNLSAVPALDSIDYDLNLDILKSPEELARERELKRQQEIERLKEEKRQQELRKQQQQQQELNAAKQAANSVPSVDRSLKPKPATFNNNTTVTDGEQRPQTGVNIIRNKTDLAEMRRALEEPDKNELKPKNTNVARQAELDKAAKPAQVPAVNRSLKPSPNGSSIETADTQADKRPSPLPEDIDVQELQELKANTLQRQDELQRFQSENKRLALEHQARLAKLQAEEEKIEHLREMKSREMKETADLMRMKKKVEEEIRQLEQEKTTRETEERRRKDEIVRMKKEGDEKARRVQELERLRAERKKAEGKKKVQEDEAAAAEKRLQDVEEQERKAADALARQQALAKAEEDRKAELARKEKEKAEKEKAEKERKERERKEREQREAQQKQEEERQRREREAAAAAAKKQADLAAQTKVVSQPGLPVGWEKRVDGNSGRTYYVDHKTKQTHWSLPPGAARQPSGSPGHTFKAKLKDEDSAPSGGGLKRSHSSPNIAKLVDEEGDSRPGAIPHVRPQPLVDRVHKPTQLTIQTDVSAAKVRNLQPTWGSVGRGLTGLRNIGNTCYINSTIQCLSNTTPLVTYLLTDAYRNHINRVTSPHKGKIAEEFAILIKSLWTGQYRSVVPRDFKNLLGKKYKPFAGFEHEDSQELLLFLMDWLHEDLNTVTDNSKKKLPEQKNDGVPDAEAAETAWRMHKTLNSSMIIDIFQGQYKSTTTCLNCGKPSVVFEPFMFLTLPIPVASRCSLRDCLLKFSEEEKVTGKDCTGCKRKGDARKNIVIWKLPSILLIILNRFYNQGMWREKISAYVDFPLELDMNGYVAGPKTRPTYSLYGVSNHYGRLEGGHYTAYCRNHNTQRWHKFDDHEVYDMSKSEIKSSAAYILFYSSMQLDSLRF